MPSPYLSCRSGSSPRRVGRVGVPSPCLSCRSGGSPRRRQRSTGVGLRGRQRGLLRLTGWRQGRPGELRLVDRASLRAHRVSAPLPLPWLRSLLLLHSLLRLGRRLRLGRLRLQPVRRRAQQRAHGEGGWRGCSSKQQRCRRSGGGGGALRALARPRRLRNPPSRARTLSAALRRAVSTSRDPPIAQGGSPSRGSACLAASGRVAPPVAAPPIASSGFTIAVAAFSLESVVVLSCSSRGRPRALLLWRRSHPCSRSPRPLRAQRRGAAVRARFVVGGSIA